MDLIELKNIMENKTDMRRLTAQELFSVVEWSINILVCPGAYEWIDITDKQARAKLQSARCELLKRIH